MPWNSFEPPLVTAFTSKPPKLPWRTSNGASRTCNSFTASSDTEREFVSAPGVPVAPSPNTSRSVAPSICTLFMRFDMPPAE